MKNDNLANIVYFGAKDTPIKFVTLPIWIDYVFYSNGKSEKKQFALIGLKDINLDVHVIHPISQFIMDFWKNKQYNTQRKHCNNVVKFLNYIKKENNLIFIL